MIAETRTRLSRGSSYTRRRFERVNVQRFELSRGTRCPLVLGLVSLLSSAGFNFVARPFVSHFQPGNINDRGKVVKGRVRFTVVSRSLPETGVILVEPFGQLPEWISATRPGQVLWTGRVACAHTCTPIERQKKKERKKKEKKKVVQLSPILFCQSKFQPARPTRLNFFAFPTIRAHIRGRR